MCGALVYFFDYLCVFCTSHGHPRRHNMWVIVGKKRGGRGVTQKVDRDVPCGNPSTSRARFLLSQAQEFLKFLISAKVVRKTFKIPENGTENGKCFLDFSGYP